MPIKLRQLEFADRELFAKWWRDADLIALTSGSKKRVTDKEVESFFSRMLQSRTDRHLIIAYRKKAIGHLALIKRGRGWFETQIIIGEKQYWGKGYGTEAVGKLMDLAVKDGIRMIFLEVRPDNLRAIRAYEKCGFTQVKLVEHATSSNLPLTVRMEWDGK